MSRREAKSSAGGGEDREDREDRSEEELRGANGEPMASNLLARILMGPDLPPGGVSFLPSSARSASLVADDLAWLQSNSAGPVRLQLEEIQL